MALGLADRYALEYQSIDRDVRWLPGWEIRNRDEQRQLLSNMVARNRWIMDGSGASTFDIRVPRADLIIWLRLPRLTSLIGVARRVLSNYGRVRVAMADGCPEPIPDREFLSYIWNFERKTAPAIISQIDRYGPWVPVTMLTSHRDAKFLLSDG